MAAEPITVTDLNQVGRTTARDPNLPGVFITDNADMTAAVDITYDFTLINQQQQFGIVRALFVDNSSNPSEIEVSVSGSDQFFTIPATSEGYFKIDGVTNSRIRLVSLGGASDIVTVTMYNYDIPGVVWYRTSTSNPTVTIPDGNDVAEGATTAVAYNSSTGAANGTVVGLLKGIFVRVFGNGLQADAAVINPAASASMISLLKGLVSLSLWPATPTVTSVASALANTVIIAANANAKARVLYNASTSAINLSFGGNATTAAQITMQLAAGEKAVIDYYVGAINGAWIAVNGTMQVTEIV